MTERRKITGSADRQLVFVDSSLYEEFEMGDLEDEGVREFFYGGGTVDAYCHECQKLSTFHFGAPYRGPTEDPPKPPLHGVVTKTGNCGRGGIASHNGCGGVFCVSLFRSHELVTKIGQYPSRKVCDFGLLDPVFNRELESRLRDELGAAVGLRAHGIGIGSFVYIRRIVEVLIEEAHEQARERPGWDEDKYSRSNTVERIKLLSRELPGQLVGGASLYSILSKGLHELSEDECKSHFDLVFQTIEMILRRRTEAKEQARLASKLDQAKSQLKNREG